MSAVLLCYPIADGNPPFVQVLSREPSIYEHFIDVYSTWQCIRDDSWVHVCAVRIVI